MIFILFHSYHLFVVSLESKYVKCVILNNLQACYIFFGPG